MKDLIKIEINENNEQVVSGRELYKFLEIKTPYTQWFERMKDYGFIENIDFILVSQKCETNNPKNPYTEIQDHLIKIPMAKEISMIQRNEKGKQARQYFIKCEEAWNSEEMIMARALEIQKRKIIGYTEQIKYLENKIEEQAPKVLFANTVSASESSTLVGNVAKLITQGGHKIGQNQFFTWLRENGFLIKRNGESYNMPTQKSMELGLFEIKERTGVNPDGSIRISKTPMITGKGQQHFINIFLGKIGVAI